MTNQSPTIDPAWLEHAKEIARRMKEEGPENFCAWPSIYLTMFGHPREQTWHELGYLKTRPDWKTRWVPALVEDKVGNPPPCSFYPASSGNLIHHCWQVARFEEATGIPVHNMARVFEFGGGYGSMCRLLSRLGFAGDYVILDLRELCELQRWYLGELGVMAAMTSLPRDVERFMANSIREQPLGWSLFIATWSLSEVPIEARAPVLELARQCDAFLICYQDKFKELENTAAFALWQATMPEIDWRVMPIGYMPGNTQLMGFRRETT